MIWRAPPTPRSPAASYAPGLEMVVEVDTAGLDPALGIMPRIPATGRIEVEVQEMPTLDLTVIPFLWDADPPLGSRAGRPGHGG